MISCTCNFCLVCKKWNGFSHLYIPSVISTLVLLLFSSLHSGISGLICLESDNDDSHSSESGCGGEMENENESIARGFGVVKDLDWSSRFVESSCYLGMLML